MKGNGNEKKFVLKQIKMAFMVHIMKILKGRTVLRLVSLEMIQMIIWQNVVLNGYTKMASMPFVCLRETITTVMSTVRLRELRQRLRG